MKKSVYKFYQDLYHQEFVFIPEWTEAEVYEVFNEPLKPAGGAAFITNGVVIIWLKDFSYETLDFLVHESIHAGNMTFQLRGVEISVKNDEAQAYLVQWIFENCKKHLKLKKK